MIRLLCVVQLCIHAPKTAHARGHRAPASAVEGQTSWSQLLQVLDTLQALLKENAVPSFLQRKLFMQLFSFMNVQLFNQLLLRRECCSFANGEYVKHGLAQVRRAFSLSVYAFFSYFLYLFSPFSLSGHPNSFPFSCVVGPSAVQPAAAAPRVLLVCEWGVRQARPRAGASCFFSRCRLVSLLSVHPD
jgi:hypothetical protein